MFKIKSWHGLTMFRSFLPKEKTPSPNFEIYLRLQKKKNNEKSKKKNLKKSLKSYETSRKSIFENGHFWVGRGGGQRIVN